MGKHQTKSTGECLCIAICACMQSYIVIIINLHEKVQRKGDLVVSFGRSILQGLVSFWHSFLNSSISILVLQASVR